MSHLALFGFGTMGRSIARSPEVQVGAVLLQPGSTATLPDGVQRFDSVQGLLGWQSALVVECAGHGAVATGVPAMLAAGIDVVLASTSAVADPAVPQSVEIAALGGGTRATLAAGALGGLEALATVGPGYLLSVRYTGESPRWHGAAHRARKASIWGGSQPP